MTMLSVSPLVSHHHAPRPPAPLLDEWRGVLNALRVVALQCRVAARTDLFEACALIANTSDAAQDTYAQALFKCMQDAVARKPVFYKPGTVELSFDEAWLIRTLMAAKEGDQDSMAFLIRSRVDKMRQRHIAFLINGIAARFV